MTTMKRRTPHFLRTMFPRMPQTLPLFHVAIVSILCGCCHSLVVVPSSTHRTTKILHSSRLMASSSTPDNTGSTVTRRRWINDSSIALVGLFTVGATSGVKVNAEEDFFDDPEIQEMYNNPEIPQAPEERSGLVVLRVAEVAQFQEKILRAIVSGDLKDVQVSPMQFVYGNQILLKNSNLDGNMKLMIYNEIPKSKRKLAIKNAVDVMNTLQEITNYAGRIQRDFRTEEMVQLADMYLSVRLSLNQMYECLPQNEKDKYYGFFMAVTEYEKKIAEGTYNPDIDGVLKFD